MEKISKTIDEINDIDGDPIFTFKVTVDNDLLGTKTYYRSCRLSELDGRVTTITGLPVGTYEVVELESLRYEYSLSNISNTSVIEDVTEATKGKQFTINDFNFSDNSLNTITLNFKNNLKSKNYDSDNDVLINRFVVEGDHCKVERDKLN